MKCSKCKLSAVCLPYGLPLGIRYLWRCPDCGGIHQKRLNIAMKANEVCKEIHKKLPGMLCDTCWEVERDKVGL